MSNAEIKGVSLSKDKLCEQFQIEINNRQRKRQGLVLQLAQIDSEIDGLRIAQDLVNKQ